MSDAQLELASGVARSPDGGWPSVRVLVRAGIAAFALYHLALAALMAFAPHAFFKLVGPFGVRNDHYIRDIATYNSAIGVALGLSLRRTSWQVPLLGLVALQFALHSLNHLVDIDRADPRWIGYFDFGSLAVSAVLLVGLWRIASAGPAGKEEAS